MALSTRMLAAAGLAGLIGAGALLSLLPRSPGDKADPRASTTAATGIVHAHHGLPSWAESGYRSAERRRITGTIERDRDATGPTYVLVEADGRRLRIAYANNGNVAFEAALRGARGGVYTLDGTVLDWGRGIRTFDMGQPLTMTR